MNFVEIDLLRGGKPVLRLPRGVLASSSATAYIVNVIRAGDPDYEFYPVNSDPEGARRWFLAHRAEFEDGLHEFAEEIGAGTDDDSTLRRTAPFGGRLKVGLMGQKW